jgi:hypothetical protein
MERKVFFFEKKNQKTFFLKSPLLQQGAFKKSKVFCFFFSKKKCCPFCLNDTYLTVWLVAAVTNAFYRQASGRLMYRKRHKLADLPRAPRRNKPSLLHRRLIPT